MVIPNSQSYIEFDENDFSDVKSQDELREKEQKLRLIAYQNELKRHRRAILRALSVKEAFTLAFTKNNLLLKGRASRSEFWQVAWPIFLGYFTYLIINFACITIFSYDNLGLIIMMSNLSFLFYPLFFLLSCIAVRRFKDINWHCPILLGFIPFIAYLGPFVSYFLTTNQEVFSYEDLYFYSTIFTVVKCIPLLFLIPLSFQGTEGPNRYGVDPIELRIYDEDMALYEQQKQMFDLYQNNLTNQTHQ